MKPVIVLTVLGGLVALFLVLRSPQPAAVGAPPGSVADQAHPRPLSDEDELAALRAEVQALRAEQSALAMRVAELDSRPVAVAAREPVGGPSTEEVAKAMEMVAAIQDPDRAAAPGLETFVLDVMQDKEERERKELEEVRRTALADALNERVLELSTELGLSRYQQQQLYTVLSTEATRRDEFFEELRKTGTWDRRAMRDTMGKLREETLGSLQSVMTPEQLTRYRELRDEERPPFFGGGWGRGSGDGERDGSGESREPGGGR